MYKISHSTEEERKETSADGKVKKQRTSLVEGTAAKEKGKNTLNDDVMDEGKKQGMYVRIR